MKLSFTLPLFAFLLLTHAQDCNNPLLQTFNLSSLDAPVEGNDLAFCNNLREGQTCCSAETVLNFQSRLDNLTSSLQALAGERDTYIAELFSNYTHQYQELADDLSDFDQEVRDIHGQDQSIGLTLGNQIRFLHNLNRALDNIDDNFRGAFEGYQDARQQCFTTLLEVQSNAWCLACDANYASFFDTNGNVNASPDLCNSIQDACRPFLFDSNNLNPIYQAQQSYGRLQSIIGYLTDFRANGTIPDTQIIDDQWTESNWARKTSGLPANCTEDNCEWLCTNLFNGQFVLNQALAANGAGVEGSQDVRYAPLPLIIGRSGSRFLQEAQAWNPDLTSTGLEFNVEADPAGARNLLPNDDDTDGEDDHVTDATDNEEDPDTTDGLPDDDDNPDVTDDNPDVTDGDPSTPTRRRLQGWSTVFRAN